MKPDLHQIAYLTVLENLPKYDPDHQAGASIITFIRSRVCTKLWNQRKKLLQSIPFPTVEAVEGEPPTASNPLTDRLTAEACQCEGVDDTVAWQVDVENFKASLPQLLSCLSDRESTVLQMKYFEELKAILESEMLITDIIKTELLELKSKYGDERRTEIIDAVKEFNIEDLIADEEMVVVISHTGNIKRMPISVYRRQHRGGVGVMGMGTKEGDFVEHIFVASAHQYILFFTDSGKCYWLKVFQIPEGSRTSIGRAIVNLLRVEND